MGDISTVAVGKMIEAFHTKDEKKFFAYANLIADNLEKSGDLNGAKIIRKRISNEHINDAIVTLS